MSDRSAERVAAAAEWLEAVAHLLRIAQRGDVAVTGAGLARVLDRQARDLYDLAAEFSSDEARRRAA